MDRSQPEDASSLLKQETFAKAVKLLQVVTADVEQLLTWRAIFWDVQKIIQENTKLHVPSAFYAWMKDMYVSGIAMAVRRLLDDDRGAQSLLSLLYLLRENPEIVSYERFLTLHDDWPEADPLREIGELDTYLKHSYEQLVGPVTGEESAHHIIGDIKKLRKAGKRITLFANKVIAHSDPWKPTATPTFREVDRTIDLIRETVDKYQGLLRSTTLVWGPNFQYDWKAIFRVAWLESDHA